jgi:hypothetical protein
LFFVHGFDLSGDVGSLSRIGASKSVLEVTSIDKSGVERLTKLGDGAIEFRTFFNDAAEKSHVALKAVPTTDIIAMYVQGGAVGDEAACLVGKQSNYDHERGEDGSLAATVLVEANAVPLEWCLMLTAGIDTFASSGAGASKNDGASSANGLRGYLEIVDIASGTPTVVIEDSPNNSTWTTLKAFAAVTAGNEPTAERVTVTGTVDQYLRLNLTGTFTDADIAVAYQRGSAKDDEDLS